MLESLWSLPILYSRILGLISSHILFKITQLLSISHLVTLRVSCFSWIFKAISSEICCPTSMPFSLTKTAQFPAYWILTGQFKFQEHQPYIYRTKPSSRKIHTLHLNYFSPCPVLRWKALDKIKIRSQKSSFSFYSVHAYGKRFSIQHFSGLYSWNAVTSGNSPYASYSHKKIITKICFNSFNSGLRPVEKVDRTNQAKPSFSR